MSLNLNNVVLAGHLTRDPELRQIGTDRVVASTGLAVNRRWKDANGQQHEEATFIDIEAWGRTAELMGKYLTKGSPVYLEGRLKLDAWDDKESGQKRTKIKVVADSVQFLGQRPASETDEGANAPKASAAPTAHASRPAPARRPAPTTDAPF